MIRFLFLLLIVPGVSRGQQEKEVRFDNELSWAQLKAKAHQENKYIFVDCFASWCAPCKAMDKQVYKDQTVSPLMNDEFICVKIQMDTTPNDDQRIQMWYADAHFIQQEYKVKVFPTLLFFSPDGKIVQRDEGYKNPEEFIGVAKAAKNSKFQYYQLLENYRRGNKEYRTMPLLAQMANKMGEMAIAERIAADYINNYLLKSQDDQIYTEANIKFLSEFLNSSTNRLFYFFYNEQIKIDSAIKQNGYALRIVDYIVFLEEIFPFYETAEKSNDDLPWKQIKKSIKKNFPRDVVDRNVIGGKAAWYHYMTQRDRKYWAHYLKFIIKKIERYGPDPTYIGGPDNHLNDIAWHDIFKHSNERSELQTAARWMKNVVERTLFEEASYLDTYANLLYKLGQNEKAIELEQKAFRLDPKYQKTFDKMRAGELTWPAE